MTTDITDKSVRPLVASVWLVHGLYNKLLGGSPRHLAIVQSVPGLQGDTGRHVLVAVGVCEVGIAAWMLTRRAPKPRRTNWWISGMGCGQPAAAWALTDSGSANPPAERSPAPHDRLGNGA